VYLITLGDYTIFPLVQPGVMITAEGNEIIKAGFTAISPVFDGSGYDACFAAYIGGMACVIFDNGGDSCVTGQAQVVAAGLNIGLMRVGFLHGILILIGFFISTTGFISSSLLH
jgi:hypothetical protein